MSNLLTGEKYTLEVGEIGALEDVLGMFNDITPTPSLARSNDQQTAEKMIEMKSVKFLSSKEEFLQANGGAENLGVASPSSAPSPKRPSGLSTAEAEDLLAQYGPNEVPVIQKTMLELLLEQFVGTMPFILEVCVIVSAAVRDWADFGVIFAMLILNGLIGLNEQLKARRELSKLTDTMISTISVSRDGSDTMIPVTLLVPGDVILVQGGNMIPADVEWVEGDILMIDTAAMTGEPIPRKYPSKEHGSLILSGCTVKAGEAYCVVMETGPRTEIGRGQSEIVADRQSASVSVFESKVLFVVKNIIAAAVVIAITICLVQGIGRDEFKSGYHNPLLAALAILIAAVPVALPLVMQVTMAIGAAKMASVHHAVVTRMSALQDIASMQVLCSDKTGTITTAKMTIFVEKAVSNTTTLQALMAGGDFPMFNRITGQNLQSLPTQENLLPSGMSDISNRELLLVLAAMGSNVAKVGDAIDSAVFRSFNELDNRMNKGLQAMIDENFEKLEQSGFNPEYKRTVTVLRQKSDGKKLIIAKGLLSKILDTSNGEKDSAPKQWRCVECEDSQLVESINHIDENLAKKGYKTIAVAVGEEGGPMYFVGILPMIDPPRGDSKRTIRRLREAGVEVKMITGDHLNIAKETARLVGMSTNIELGERTRDGTHERDDLVRHAGGFAQVLPRDKRECVRVLQRAFGYVVGMTGDGVNDAPALSAAQCGIAVADATDAAKNAAAMVLTEEGLGAVFAAVIESRKISARLMAYVSYRFATTIQILISLTVIVLFFNCEINTLYIILLALLNDLTMIPIAEDRQTASMSPIRPSIKNLVRFSFALGFFQAVFSILFYANLDKFLVGPLSPRNTAASQVVLIAEDGFYCNDYAQAAVWLQISISSELLIFVTRAPGHFFLSMPSKKLIFSTVIMGGVLCSFLSAYLFPGGGGQDSKNRGLRWHDIGVIWLYDLLCLLVLDYIKLGIKLEFDHDTSGVLDEARYAREDAAAANDEYEDNTQDEEETKNGSRSIRSLSNTSSGGIPAPRSLEQLADFLTTGKKFGTSSGFGGGGIDTIMPQRGGAQSRQESFFRSQSF